MEMPSDGAVSLPASLQDAKIPSLPQTAYYIANFISEEEEQMILDKVCYSTFTLLCFFFFAIASGYMLTSASGLDRCRPEAAMETTNPPPTADLALRPRA